MSTRRPVTVHMARLLRKLATLPTRSPPARELKMQLERLLMRILVADGLRGVDHVIAALNAGERRLALVGKHAAGRKWREELAAGRTLEIDVIGGDVFRGTYVEYKVARKLRFKPRHALQEAFYARYMAVGQKAYRDPRYRLAPPDRLVLLIGELEADVNNGGFDQYLHNKGRRRALATLAALRTVGARKTADMLKKAMAPGASPDQRSALDERFYKVPEDLAVLAARHVELRAAP